MKLEKIILVEMMTIIQYLLKNLDGHTFHVLPEMKLCFLANNINGKHLLFFLICM